MSQTGSARRPGDEAQMPEALIECIPNFSEGRRVGVVDEIEAAIRAVTTVRMLDRNMDHDHNRCVLSFAGSPEGVVEAAFAAIRRASELIDMTQHKGEHPRIGATDVVPFVPLSGATMEDCVALARRLGERVGSELGIPVYLYEAAASRPERANLENIRRGEYEGLRDEIISNPDRAPDFGPSRLGKAGATVIGARAPLVAYNVYLTTDDVEIARKVAAAIRQSSGGLRFVKALGMLVDGRAQVSMNLTDFTRTPIARVVEMIRREAARYGVGVHHAELVGLIPQMALVEAARWYLQLDQFQPDQVLEARLYAGQGDGPAGAAFLADLAAGTATPGGGSAAAYAGAMAAALVGMVARLTRGKKKYADVEERMRAIEQSADALRSQLHTAVAQDARAFDGVMNALRLPRGTEPEQEQRLQALEEATRQAALVPLGVARLACEVLELAAEACEIGNLNAISDAASAAALARASLTGADRNVRVNAASLRDASPAEAWLTDLSELGARADAAEARTRGAFQARLG
jgi:glutamate formiminotransferase/formiminotetrahydrofolate cyclodeaminase